MVFAGLHNNLLSVILVHYYATTNTDGGSTMSRFRLAAGIHSKACPFEAALIRRRAQEAPQEALIPCSPRVSPAQSRQNCARTTCDTLRNVVLRLDNVIGERIMLFTEIVVELATASV